MKILIIGSTTYLDSMIKYKDRRILLLNGDEIRIAEFDSFKGSEYAMCSLNRSNIEWADEIHILWDGRSTGTIFDIGMCFALRKKIKIVYLESKSFINFVKEFEKRGS